MNYFEKATCTCRNGILNPYCPLHAKKQTSKWDLHFRRVSKRPQVVATFSGLFDPAKTIPDLKSLLTAKDNEILQIIGHLKEVTKSGGSIDPAWMKDWAALNKRYFVAKQAARKYMDAPGLSLPKPYYDAVLKSIQVSYPDLRVSPGDLQDLFNRMPFAMKSLPQPGEKPLDTTYQALDTAATHMPTPIKASVATFQPDLVPQTKDAGSYDAAKKQMEAAGDWISHNLMLVAVIAGGVAVVSVASKMPSFANRSGSGFYGRRRARL